MGAAIFRAINIPGTEKAQTITQNVWTHKNDSNSGNYLNKQATEVENRDQMLSSILNFLIYFHSVLGL